MLKKNILTEKAFYFLFKKETDASIDYKDKINLNQQRLQEIEERLNIINHLKNKYGNSIEKIFN